MKEKNLTLLIMAAGMGSRFGGLKQIEPIGPNGEFLIDYSIYDAIRVGFKRVVFVIKEENYDVFKNTIGSRVEDKIETLYAFQKMEDLPFGLEIPKMREKPWGTAHAIWSARDLIDGPFVIINADDFYGYDSYFKISEFLENNNNCYALAGYKVSNTLTSSGAVKRGVCEMLDGYLTEIIESNVIEENGEIIATPLDGRESFKIQKDTYVSMNMIGFYPDIFKYIEEYFVTFFENNKDNLLKAEYLIPDLLEKLTLEDKVRTQVIPTTAKWEGITYKEDKDNVIKSLNLRISNGEYPNKLWD